MLSLPSLVSIHTRSLLDDLFSNSVEIALKLTEKNLKVCRPTCVFDELFLLLLRLCVNVSI